LQQLLGDTIGAACGGHGVGGFAGYVGMLPGCAGQRCQRSGQRWVTHISGVPVISLSSGIGDSTALGCSIAHRDTNAEKLWQALLGRDYDVTEVMCDGTSRGTLYKLRSPGVRFLMGDSSSASHCLFVRPWADAVYRLSMQHRTSMSNRPFSGVLLRGTPGIGKSWWLQFVLLCLARDSSSHAVFFESVEQDAAWLLQPNGCVELFKFHRSRGLSNSANDALADPDTTYLFDPCGERSVEPTAVQAFRVVASSPDPRNYKQFAKNLEGVTRFKLDDLLAFAPSAAPSLSVDEVTNRFHHYGGVSRPVYARDRGIVDKELGAAIESETLDSLFMVLSKREPVGSNAPSHKLLHHLVFTSGANAYIDYSMVFASAWVGRAVMERRMVAERDELVKVASGARDLGGVLRGRAYEAVTRSQLQGLTNFFVRNLSYVGHDAVSGYSICVQDYEPIHQPTDPNEVVDMVAHCLGADNSLPTLLLFNCTVDLQHGAKSKPLNAYIKLLLQNSFVRGRGNERAATATAASLTHAPRSAATTAARVMYVWVVPSDIAPHFKLQRKSPASGPNFDARLEQVLLVLDPRAGDTSRSSVTSNAFASHAALDSRADTFPSAPAVAHCSGLPVVSSGLASSSAQPVAATATASLHVVDSDDGDPGPLSGTKRKAKEEAATV
jgi:hypothetical protein